MVSRRRNTWSSDRTRRAAACSPSRVERRRCPPDCQPSASHPVWMPDGRDIVFAGPGLPGGLSRARRTAAERHGEILKGRWSGASELVRGASRRPPQPFRRSIPRLGFGFYRVRPRLYIAASRWRTAAPLPQDWLAYPPPSAHWSPTGDAVFIETRQRRRARHLAGGSRPDRLSPWGKWCGSPRGLLEPTLPRSRRMARGLAFTSVQSDQTRLGFSRSMPTAARPRGTVAPSPTRRRPSAGSASAPTGRRSTTWRSDQAGRRLAGCAWIWSPVKRRCCVSDIASGVVPSTSGHGTSYHLARVDRRVAARGRRVRALLARSGRARTIAFHVGRCGVASRPIGAAMIVLSSARS